ncbi:membrane protein [Tsukamurella sp. TY48]|nr:membrane protein [Tsukamurella sp. TY48]
MLDQMGGWQGLVYSALPVAAFVPANAVWGLKGGVIAALAVAAVVMVIRLATRTSIQPAISGFFGVAVCVAIALLVGGSGRGYYLYGIVMQAVFAVVFAVSIVVRWPLVGVLWHLFDERSKQAVDGGHDWRADRRQYRGFVWLTVLWIAMFTVRFVVQLVLYLNDDVNWLGVARIAMGWPMFALGLLVTFVVARKLTHADSE